MYEITAFYTEAFRRALRITHKRLDEEINDLIAAGRSDLVLGGILLSKAKDECDPLIKRALTQYVKAEFGLDNADSVKYRESYEALKRHLALSDEYTKGDEA